MAGRLTVVIADMHGGGAQRVLATMSGPLAAYFAVTVLTLDEPTNDFFHLPPQVRRVSIGYSSGQAGVLANIARIRRLRRAIRESRPHVVLAFLAQINILVVLATWGLRLPTVIGERNDPAQQSFGWKWDLLRRLTYRRADVISANSRRALRSMEAYVPTERLALLPNPVVAPASPSPADRRPAILFVGRLVPQKRPLLLLEGFAEIAKAYPQWTLTIVGDGPLRPTIEARARELGLEERVVLTGHVRDVWTFYRQAGVFAIVSQFEGSPNALLEAMVHGMPCVASSGIGLPGEFVRDGVDGLVFDDLSKDALVDCLRRLVESPDLRARLGEEASKRMEAMRPEAVARTWSTVLEGAMAARVPR